MKRILLTWLGIVLVVGVLAGVGFSGYRFGYAQGATAASGDDALTFLRGNGFEFHRMPMHNFERGMGPNFQRGFGRVDMLVHRGGGFGFFSPLHFLFQIAVLGFIIWLAYKFFTGWRLSFTPPTTQAAPQTPKVEPVETETKPSSESG